MVGEAFGLPPTQRVRQHIDEIYRLLHSHGFPWAKALPEAALRHACRHMTYEVLHDDMASCSSHSHLLQLMCLMDIFVYAVPLPALQCQPANAGPPKRTTRSFKFLCCVLWSSSPGGVWCTGSVHTLSGPEHNALAADCRIRPRNTESEHCRICRACTLSQRC